MRTGPRGSRQGKGGGGGHDSQEVAGGCEVQTPRKWTEDWQGEGEGAMKVEWRSGLAYLLQPKNIPNPTA